MQAHAYPYRIICLAAAPGAWLDHGHPLGHFRHLQADNMVPTHLIHQASAPLAKAFPAGKKACSERTARQPAPSLHEARHQPCNQTLTTKSQNQRDKELCPLHGHGLLAPDSGNQTNSDRTFQAHLYTFNRTEAGESLLQSEKSSPVGSP